MRLRTGCVGCAEASTSAEALKGDKVGGAVWRGGGGGGCWGVVF